ncbi:MAG: flavodoxin-dependent (E)-4-hydroxy-3-methylbut-2-enyl-diphosphate synthase [Clostridiales bacterium]|nr:flavodoxin-dependent (E)-4-hydroxy-3-methylbut-2-enyl-diphosphate synthase [Clostridiales bacterium]
MSDIVKIGKVTIGGGNPIAIQSMANVDPHDKQALIAQVKRLADKGCDIMRLTVPDMEAAETFGIVKRELVTEGYDIPLVADIHFDYKLAIAAIENGADKIRINPGNIGSIDRVREVVKAASERQVPIRVGVNSGSLEKHIVDKYHGVTAEGLAESALDNLKIIEDLGYDNLVVSIKSSNVKMNYDAHMLLTKGTSHPIHVGITEAGTLKRGKVKSAIGIGSLLLNGIGDTMRVSLTADPIEEVIYAKEILRTLGMRPSAVDLVSCPTCGRTKIDLEALANEIEEGLESIEERLLREGKPGIKVAVMGCAVNGPGEAREANFGVAGGQGEGLIFSKGQILMKVPEKDIVPELFKLIEENVF